MARIKSSRCQVPKDCASPKRRESRRKWGEQMTGVRCWVGGVGTHGPGMRASGSRMARNGHLPARITVQRQGHRAAFTASTVRPSVRQSSIIERPLANTPLHMSAGSGVTYPGFYKLGQMSTTDVRANAQNP